MKVRLAPLATLFIAILMLFYVYICNYVMGVFKKKAEAHSAEAVQYP